MTQIYHGYRVRALAAQPDDKPGQPALLDLPEAQAPPRQLDLMDLPPQSRPAKAKPRGHMAPPGTGPPGETCGTCTHHLIFHAGLNRAFLKCALARARWTNGKGSDISKRDPSCSHWQAQKGAEP